MAGHDVVHVFVEQGGKDLLELFTQVIGLDFGRVGQAVHHIGDAAVLQGFGNGFPAVLNQFGGIGRIKAFFNHLVVAEDRPHLENTAEDGLLAHEIGFYLGHKRGLKYTGLVAAGACGIGLGQFQPFAPGIVFPVHGNEGGNTETSFVLFPDFGAGGFGGHHDHGEIFPDLHAFFNNVESVGIGEAGIFFHQRHDRFNHIGVLLVRGQVDDQVGCGQHVFIGADAESVFRGIFPGLPLVGDGGFPEGIGDIQAAVSQVQSLVKALGSAAHDDDFFALQGRNPVEFGRIHEPAL